MRSVEELIDARGRTTPVYDQVMHDVVFVGVWPQANGIRLTILAQLEDEILKGKR